MVRYMGIPEYPVGSGFERVNTFFGVVFPSAGKKGNILKNNSATSNKNRRTM